VGNTAARRHQVELTRPDHLLAAQAVAVQHVPGRQPGDGLQSDVRMRWHVHSGDAVDGLRPVVVDEAPGADAAAQPHGQHPPDRYVTYSRLPCLGYFKIHTGNGAVRDLHVCIDCAHSLILASEPATRMVDR